MTTGEVVWDGGAAAKRIEAAQAKVIQRAEALRINSLLQLHLAVQEARGRVGGIELEIKGLQREAADLEAELAEAREKLADTGIRNPKLPAMAAAAAQSGEVMAAAHRRLEVARSNLADAIEREAAANRGEQGEQAIQAEMRKIAEERVAKVKAAGDKARAGR